MNHETHAPCNADERYYRTTDLYLATYLYAHGEGLVNVERETSGPHRFVFRNSVEREVFVHEFRHGPEALVDARAFVCALEELQRRAEETNGAVKSIQL